MTKFLSTWLAIQLFAIGITSGLNYFEMEKNLVNCYDVFSNGEDSVIARSVAYVLIPVLAFTDVEDELYDYCVAKSY